jgi:thioredoxin 1
VGSTPILFRHIIEIDYLNNKRDNIMQSNSIVEINAENFQDMVLQFEGLSVVDFWSETCVPCKQMMRILEEIVQDVPSNVRIVKVNSDQHMELVETYKVRSLPTLLFFKNGLLVETKTGVDRKQVIRKAIESYIH